MQLFYFHQVGCKARVFDDKGLSLPDLSAANAPAQIFAAMHVFQAGHAEPFPCDAAVEVCDKTGAMVHLECPASSRRRSLRSPTVRTPPSLPERVQLQT